MSEQHDDDALAERPHPAPERRYALPRVTEIRPAIGDLSTRERVVLSLILRTDRAEPGPG